MILNFIKKKSKYICWDTSILVANATGLVSTVEHWMVHFQLVDTNFIHMVFCRLG